MRCTACGGSPTDDTWKNAPVRFRATGDPKRPYIAVCECCGCDVDYTSGRNPATDRVSMLGRISQGGMARLFEPS